MKILLVLFSLILFSGCNEDPYPVINNTEDGGRNENDADTKPPEDAISIAVDDIIRFREGRLRKYKVQVKVQKPGVPVVQVDDLPPGASFDAATNEIVWTPDFFAGNDVRDPSIKTRSYPIKIWVWSSLDEEQQDKLWREVSLEVSDVPRAIDITSESSVSVQEADTLTYKFKIDNLDYPRGPFKVITSDFPANTELKKIDENNFEITFTPDYFHVNLSQERYVEYTPKIVVSNPANHIEEKTFSLRVNDTRLGVSLQTPNTRDNPVLEQGVDASFQVAAYDQNKEVAPKMELTSNVPQFGKFETELVENPNSHSSVLNIKWSDIPPGKNGETVEVGFKACVLGSSGNYDRCSEDTAKLKIVIKDRKPPVISRAQWTAGELIYLGFDEEKSKTVRIVDGEDNRLTPKVEVFPEEIRKYVKWERGKVKMKFGESGVFQFSVKASSDYGTSTTESFQVEVFPQDRSKILFFADSTRDPEVKFYKENLKDVSLMNPLIQRITQRNVSDREVLVLGTSVLFDKKANDYILDAMDKIKNIVIASPMIQNMPEKFLNELSVDYNMTILGRYNELPRMPKIGNTHFAHTSQFQAPKSEVKLKLNASVESSNPLIFNGGLDEPNKNCKGVLGLTENGSNPYVIGVACKRDNGGRLVLLGTEWADLKVSEDDKKIPTAWFNTMLKGTF